MMDTQFAFLRLECFKLAGEYRRLKEKPPKDKYESELRPLTFAERCEQADEIFNYVTQQEGAG